MHKWWDTESKRFTYQPYSSPPLLRKSQNADGLFISSQIRGGWVTGIYDNFWFALFSRPKGWDCLSKIPADFRQVFHGRPILRIFLDLIKNCWDLLRLRDYSEGSSLLFSPWNVGKLWTHADTHRYWLKCACWVWKILKDSYDKLTQLVFTVFQIVHICPLPPLMVHRRSIFRTCLIIQNFPSSKSSAISPRTKVQRKYFFYCSACLHCTPKALFPAVANMKGNYN